MQESVSQNSFRNHSDAVGSETGSSWERQIKNNSKSDHIILTTSNSSPTLDKKYQPLLNTAYPFFFSKKHQKYMHSKDNSSALQNSNTHFGTCAMTTAQTLYNCSIRLQTPYNLLAALSAETVTEQLMPQRHVWSEAAAF